MNAISAGELELGILGGGQLGKMLIEAASDWNIQCHVLDPDPDCPCALLAANFVCGSFKDYETVYQFGKNLQKITIEIEHVNVEALFQLEKEGKEIFPKPEVLKLIQDKGKQKMFYEDNGLPTANFQIIENKSELINLIREEKIIFPFVQKSCTAGYDGKGVSVIKGHNDIDDLLEGECVIEDVIDFNKELAVIVARDTKGVTKCFPAVEMEFHKEANLVEFLFAPAHIDNSISEKAYKVAVDCIEALGMYGILAVEMFLTKDGEILINEVAPRAHNSGHHTIEANYTSQYQQLLRCIFNIPLGSTGQRSKSVMINILGDENFSGEAKYLGLKDCLDKEGLYVHLYGKKITKPFRKMGHVTIIGENENLLRENANFVKQTLRVQS